MHDPNSLEFIRHQYRRQTCIICLAVTGLLLAVWAYFGIGINIVVGDAFFNARQIEGLALFQQASLPPSNTGIYRHRNKGSQFEKQFFSFTSPVFLALGYACSAVFFSLGIMSVKKTLWGVGFYGSMNINMGCVLLIVGVTCIWIGQWCLFSVLGLLP